MCRPVAVSGSYSRQTSLLIDSNRPLIDLDRQVTNTRLAAQWLVAADCRSADNRRLIVAVLEFSGPTASLTTNR